LEHYDDVGSTANPKVGVLWSPIEGLNLRTTFSESFRAPALREVSDAPIYSPSSLPLGDTRIRSLLLNGGNPDLEPETAKSWTVGFDLAPPSWPGMTLSVNGFDVRFDNRIDRPVQANIVGALADPTLTSFVERISPAANAADLARITALIGDPAFTSISGVYPAKAYGAILDNRYVNTASLRVRGIDLSGAWRFRVGDDAAGLSANASYVLDYKQRVTPTSPVVERVNVANFPLRLRGRVTADWTRDRLTALAAVNYVGAYRDPLGGKIGDSATLDLQLRLAPAERGWLEGVAVVFNARNLFDRAPPFYNNTAGVGFDPANADPIGRYVSLQLTRAW
jgi:outer membrane receptor protein involved in Fe transport